MRNLIVLIVASLAGLAGLAGLPGCASLTEGQKYELASASYYITVDAVVTASDEIDLETLEAFGELEAQAHAYLTEWRQVLREGERFGHWAALTRVLDRMLMYRLDVEEDEQ